MFFDDTNVRTTKIEGEAEIGLALKTGAVHRVIKEYVEKRMKLKVAERIAQDFMRGAVANERERLKRQAQMEYERKLKEQMERKELTRQKEERARLEDEKLKRVEEEKQKEEEELARRRLALEEKRSKVENELMQMDLSSTKIRDIKEKMDEAGINYVGATSREDLIAKLKARLPRLKLKLESSSAAGNEVCYNR